MNMRLLFATIFALAVGLGLPPVTHAASTTNYSDQWWNPGESG